MEQNSLHSALAKLLERLSSYDQQIGYYTGHVSTGKGVTVKTPQSSLYLYPFFIYKLIYAPDSFTEDELKTVIAKKRETKNR